MPSVYDSSFSRVSPLRHPVANTGLGEDVGGVFGFVAQLAAQAAYHRPHQANASVALKPPHPALGAKTLTGRYKGDCSSADGNLTSISHELALFLMTILHLSGIIGGPVGWEVFACPSASEKSRNGGRVA